MPIERDSEGQYRDQSGRQLTHDGFGGLYDSVGAKVGTTDGFRAWEHPDPFAPTASPTTAAPGARVTPGGGDGAVVFLMMVLGWPVYAELLVLFIGVYGFVSPFADWARVPRSVVPPSLGLHAIVGIVIATVAAAAYVYLHGFRWIAVALGIPTTLIWAYIVLDANNAALPSPEALRALWSGGGFPALCHAGAALHWGWAAAAAVAAIVGRVTFARLAGPSMAQVRRVRSWRDARQVASRAVRSLTGLIVVCLFLYGLIWGARMIRTGLLG